MRNHYSIDSVIKTIFINFFNDAENSENNEIVDHLIK